MDESAGPGAIQEFNAAVIGLSVFDRAGDEIGTVRDVSLDRTCILVEEPRQPLRRRHSHAPDFHQLDPASEAAIAQHYFTRLAPLGDVSPR